MHQNHLQNRLHRCHHQMPSHGYIRHGILIFQLQCCHSHPEDQQSHPRLHRVEQGGCPLNMQFWLHPDHHYSGLQTALPYILLDRWVFHLGRWYRRYPHTYPNHHRLRPRHHQVVLACLRHLPYWKLQQFQHNN